MDERPIVVQDARLDEPLEQRMKPREHVRREAHRLLNLADLLDLKLYLSLLFHLLKGRRVSDPAVGDESHFLLLQIGDKSLQAGEINLERLLLASRRRARRPMNGPIELFQRLFFSLSNHIQELGSILVIGKEWRVLPQSVRAPTKVKPLRDVQRHHMLVGLAALFEQPSDHVNRSHRRVLEVRSRLPFAGSQVEDAPVDLGRRHEGHRLSRTQLPQSHCSCPPSELVLTLIYITR